MNEGLVKIIPVLPSADINRDVQWYEKHTGFHVHHADSMYAVLYRGPLVLHLQWHAGTEDDPLCGGSVIRIQVNDVKEVFDEFLERGTVLPDSLRQNTAWGTHEFGFYDLNRNLLFIMEETART